MVKKTYLKLPVTVFVTVAVAFGLVWFGGMNFKPSAAAAAGPEKLKIGAILTMSGQMAFMGLMEKDGIELAVKEINEKGGVNIKGKKYPIEMVYFDDEALPKKALDATNSLVRKDNVKIIVGVRMNEAVETVQSMTEKEKVIVLIGVASYPGVYLGKKYGALISDSGVTEAMAAVRLMTEDPKVLEKYGITPKVDPRYDFSNKRVAFLGRDEMYCQYAEYGFKEGMEKFGPKRGLKYVGAITYPLGTTDVSPYMQKLMDMKPDIIYHDLYVYDEVKNCLRALKEMGMDWGPKGKVLTVNTNDVYNWGFVMDPLMKDGLDLTNHISGGVDMPNEMVAQYPKRADFVKLVEATYKRPPTLFEDNGYDEIMLYVKACEKAGTITDTDKIMKAMLNMTYDGVRGPGQVFVNPKSVPELAVYRGQIVQPQFIRFVTQGNKVKYTGLSYKSDVYWGTAISGDKLLF